MASNLVKKIYRYDLNKRLEVHEVPQGARLELVERKPEGDLYRLRYGDFRPHDYYGFAHRKEAKAEEILSTRRRIAEDNAWLSKLTKGLLP